jgi:enamine deaminase RidA (YjgF/YER057c/UK114 family)
VVGRAVLFKSSGVKEKYSMPSEFQVRLFNPPGISAPVGYSHVAETSGGKVVYIAGQVALKPSGELAGPGDFPTQVEQVFANLKTAVEAAGGKLCHIIKLNYYCVDSVDLAQFPALREIRDRYVNKQNPPASTFVVVRRLVRPEWLIEIEAVAAVPF